MVLYFELRYGTRLGYASETPASEASEPRALARPPRASRRHAK